MPGGGLNAWPEPYTSAISLTYDGSRHEHLDMVVPLLDSNGFAATFFVYPPNLILRVAKWREVAKRHELGNAFLYGAVDSDGLVPEWSTEAFLEEHDEAVSLLGECGAEAGCFAMPCVQAVPDANGFPAISDVVMETVIKLNQEACSAFLDRYAVVRGPRPGLNRAPVDFRLPLCCLETHGLDLDSLIAITKLAIREKAWLVLAFTPFWNEELDVATHERYVQWLAACGSAVMVAPIGEIRKRCSVPEVRLH